MGPLGGAGAGPAGHGFADMVDAKKRVSFGSSLRMRPLNASRLPSCMALPVSIRYHLTFIFS